MNVIRQIKKMVLGSYRLALSEGLIAGKGVSVMGGVSFGTEPYLITLEDNVRISNDVAFVNHDGGTWAFRDKDKYKDVVKFGRIKIGERTFVGRGSTIMPGVTIGKRCVIGAGSVVTKDIPDGSVAVGVPARVIMTTDAYADKSLSRMAEFDKEAYERDKKAYLKSWL